MELSQPEEAPLLLNQPAEEAQLLPLLQPALEEAQLLLKPLPAEGIFSRALEKAWEIADVPLLLVPLLVHQLLQAPLAFLRGRRHTAHWCTARVFVHQLLTDQLLLQWERGPVAPPRLATPPIAAGGAGRPSADGLRVVLADPLRMGLAEPLRVVLAEDEHHLPSHEHC